jgi:hypothetical protein
LPNLFAFSLQDVDFNKFVSPYFAKKSLVVVEHFAVVRYFEEFYVLVCDAVFIASLWDLFLFLWLSPFVIVTWFQNLKF